MNIQFHHRRLNTKYVLSYGDLSTTISNIQTKGGITVALQVPTIDQFNAFEIKTEDQKGFHDIVELSAGFSKCSKDDNYNKKLGRKIAQGRMQSTAFFARKINESEVILSDISGKYPELVLRRSANGSKVYLIGVK